MHYLEGVPTVHVNQNKTHRSCSLCTWTWTFIILLFLIASKLSFLPLNICREIWKEVWILMLLSGEKLCWNTCSLFPEYKKLKFVNSNTFSFPTNTVLNEEKWLIPIRQRIQLLCPGMSSTCFSQCLDQDLILLWENIETKVVLS